MLLKFHVLVGSLNSDDFLLLKDFAWICVGVFFFFMGCRRVVFLFNVLCLFIAALNIIC